MDSTGCVLEGASEERDGSEVILNIKELTVTLPSGKVLLDKISLCLRAGEVAVLLGGSGAGKSTLSRVLFEPEQLKAQGFSVTSQAIDFDRNNLGLVPQRGALFDHLNVHENIRLAQRYRKEEGDTKSVSSWLEGVGLEPALAQNSVGVLSGGQSQRVAVARALASERRLLLLDEPSVGLDPHRVRMLARLIREQTARLGLAIIVVTHDPALAAGVADKLLLLDAKDRKLKHLFGKDWPGPMERQEVDEETRGHWLLAVEREVAGAIESSTGDTQGSKRTPAASLFRQIKPRIQRWLLPFSVAGRSILAIPKQCLQYPKDFAGIGTRVLVQAAIRPALFYGIVSVLIGYTLLFVISQIGGAGVRPDVLLRQIGGSYAVALAPPLSAILFVSASGAATNAWLGSMGLTRQTAALEALGIGKVHYLWAPAWVALGVCYLFIAASVALGMLFGGWLLCQQYALPGAWDILIGDFVDPRPERSQNVGRSIFLVFLYAWGMASNLIAHGGSDKHSADEVTKAMTGSVVSSTLWVVFLELTTVLWMFR